jgi:hypothetical protein
MNAFVDIFYLGVLVLPPLIGIPIPIQVPVAAQDMNGLSRNNKVSVIHHPFLTGKVDPNDGPISMRICRLSIASSEKSCLCDSSWTIFDICAVHSIHFLWLGSLVMISDRISGKTATKSGIVSVGLSAN